jgi:hypothetical protein
VKEEIEQRIDDLERLVQEQAREIAELSTPAEIIAERIAQRETCGSLLEIGRRTIECERERGHLMKHRARRIGGEVLEWGHDDSPPEIEDDARLFCDECGEFQFETPSGRSCRNGHGGVMGFERVESTKWWAEGRRGGGAKDWGPGLGAHIEPPKAGRCPWAYLGDTRHRSGRCALTAGHDGVCRFADGIAFPEDIEGKPEPQLRTRTIECPPEPQLRTWQGSASPLLTRTRSG